MANLNIPFLLFQEGGLPFNVDAKRAKILSPTLFNQIQGNEAPAFQNYMVLPDLNTGNFFLCAQESIVQHGHALEGGKFINNIRPRLLCIPDIYPAENTLVEDYPPSDEEPAYKFMDCCLVSSPAPKILSTTSNILATIHQVGSQSGSLKLWSLDDGRCVITSPDSLLAHRKPVVLKSIPHQYISEVIICLCEDKEILIINAFTMTIERTITSEFKGAHEFRVSLNMGPSMDQFLVEFGLIDQTGRIYCFANDIKDLEGVYKGPSKKAFKKSSNIMLDSCNDSDLREGDLLKIGPLSEFKSSGREEAAGRGAHREILTFQKVNKQQCLAIYQDRIELVSVEELEGEDNLSVSGKEPEPNIKVVLQYEKKVIDQSKYGLGGGARKKAPSSPVKKEKWFIFAQFVQYKSGLFVVIIDSEQSLLIYEINELASLMTEPQYKCSLIDDARLFDVSSKFADAATGLSLLQTQEEIKKEKLEVVRGSLSKRIEAGKLDLFSFFPEKLELKTVVPSELDGRRERLITWTLEGVFGSLGKAAPSAEKVLLAQFNEIDIPSSNLPQHQLININSFIAKNYFTKHQHSFFFGDEKITCQCFYASSDFPSAIFGTNYGRILIVQLFQDIEGRSYPIIVIDDHFGCPITSLYLAYSQTRRGKRQGSDRGSTQLAQTVSVDSGGHLIAASEDGTVSITNMNAGDLIAKLSNFSVMRTDANPNKKSIDRFMAERDLNKRVGRRQSVTGLVQSTENYFNLEKIRAMKVFPCLAYGEISRVQETSILQQAQTDRHQFLQSVMTDGPLAASSQQHENGSHSPSAGGLGSGSSARSHSADQAREADSKPVFHKYSQQINGIKEQMMKDPIGSHQSSHLLQDLSPFRASYALIDSEAYAVYLLHIHNPSCDIFSITGLDSKPIGVYEDVIQGIVHVVTAAELIVYSYNKKAKQLVRKSNYMFAQSFLSLDSTLLTLVERQLHFMQATKLEETSFGKAAFDQYSFEQQYKNMKAHRSGAGSHHKVFDYLSLSLSLPLFFHPHKLLSQKYTKSLKDILPYREAIKRCLTTPPQKEEDVALLKGLLRKMIGLDFICNDRFTSDFSQEYYLAQGAVTPLLIGDSSRKDRSFRQQMVIINTRDMIHVLKSRMRVLSESLGKIQGGGGGEDGHSERTASISDHLKGSMNSQAPNNIWSEYLQSSKWPTRLLALVHPFTLDENLDENLELFFGLSNPFADFRIGVQGAGEAFSFILNRDEKAEGRSSQFEESIKLLRLCSLQHRLVAFKKETGSVNRTRELTLMSSKVSKMTFVNSEFWKTSSYLNSLMSAFFLSTLVAIVEYAQSDITILMQDWLNVVQYITSSSELSPSKSHNNPFYLGDSRYFAVHEYIKSYLQTYEATTKPLSVSVLSQLMLRRDHSISSCARDVIMKPLLSSGSCLQSIRSEIVEWQDLVLDTYIKLKEDSNQRQQTERQASRQTIPEAPNRHFSITSRHRSTDAGQTSPSQEKESQERSIHHFFGELEIRGLINLSYYSLYSHDNQEAYKIDADVQNRLCKCTVILTREIMTKFTSNSKEFQNLLTILMQLLQTQMRAQVSTFKTKVIKEDVIKILLLIYDFYKKQLRDERFLTRVQAQNFHLIHPKNSELYLKLTAAKTLLEIGTLFREDFLMLIHEQATTLKDGPEYQRNVLDVLRYFINGSKDGLEPYLVQIIQTLLKCLDPNDEQLRKNSTQLISIILSTMVKTFSMIAFHHDSQKLAVGTPNGPIAIYDVRTSAQWKVLEGHKKNVSCVQYDEKGNILASYSPHDLSLRIWKVGNAGFFSSIMGTQGKGMKEMKLKPMASREPSGKAAIRFISDKALELTREDGSVEQHRLSK